MPNRSGFTLTEILVSIAIIILLTGLAIPNFRRFSEGQELDIKAADLVEVLRQAQSGSSSSIKCTNGLPSVNWYVSLSATAENYQVWQNCRNADETSNSIVSRIGPIFLGKVDLASFNCVANTAEVTFENNQISFKCAGVDYSNNLLTITLTKDGKQKTVTVDKGGAIY